MAHSCCIEWPKDNLDRSSRDTIALQSYNTLGKSRSITESERLPRKQPDIIRKLYRILTLWIVLFTFYLKLEFSCPSDHCISWQCDISSDIKTERYHWWFWRWYWYSFLDWIM